MYKLCLAIIFLLSLSVPKGALAISEGLGKEKMDTSLPAMIEADEMHYDDKEKKVIAKGNVEIIQGKRILLADEVKYDQTTNTVEAKGNITLLEPDGSTFFAEEVELRDDLKQGVVENFSARFSDNSLIAAKKAERVSDKVLELEKVVYSPCPLCKEDPEDDPLWQVKASTAKIDEDNQRVSYRNVFFEVEGVPVLYSPYLSHATPNADRKSGFLTPKYANDRIFGTMITTPYYYNIAPNMDATISPTYTSKEGSILETQFGHLTEAGRYDLTFSATNPDERGLNGEPVPGRDFRGHIAGAGQFDINDEWRWGFDGKRSTDDTYLRRYRFGDEDVLVSKAYVNKIDDRDFIQTQAITFQGLKANDDPGQTPLIMPLADAHIETEAGRYGDRFILDANMLALTRDEGASSRRLSLKGGWAIPYITNGGQVFKLTTTLRGDAYSVDDVITNSTTEDGLSGRVVPETELKWSYPLMKHTPARQIYLEPTTSFIVSPYGGNPNRIPNEDSQDIEFSDENLFDANHFTGLDKIESGPRVNYGLRGGIFDNEYGDIGTLFGQSYRTKDDRNFSNRSGLDDNFSDYVGRVGYQYSDFVDLAYRFRIDKDSLAANRNAISTELYYSPVRLKADYLTADENSEADDIVGNNREILMASSSFELTEQWTLSGNGHRDLENGQWVSAKTDLLYSGDCLDLSFTWFQEFTRDRDIRPNNTLSFNVSLKNLGY